MSKNKLETKFVTFEVINEDFHFKYLKRFKAHAMHSLLSFLSKYEYEEGKIPTKYLEFEICEFIDADFQKLKSMQSPRFQSLISFFNINLSSEAVKEINEGGFNADYFKVNEKRFYAFQFWDIRSPQKNYTTREVMLGGAGFNNILPQILTKIATRYLNDFTFKEQEVQQKLKELKSIFIAEWDKDNNGVIDVIEDDVFNNLLKKHQKKIIEIDRTYMQNFVKVANSLKTKKDNIQGVFAKVMTYELDLNETPANATEILELKRKKPELTLVESKNLLSHKRRDLHFFDELCETLRNEIHGYELILFHSLNMIVSLCEEDMMTFYEIYEAFDKMGIWNSNWENEVSKKLSNIDEGLSELIRSINEMEKNIVNEIGYLSYVTQAGFSDLESSVTSQLKEIDSSLQAANLLASIQTYQTYKINRNTKGLSL